MLVIGLTGGIGAGKSTVAQLFADRGVPLIDADLIARKVAEPNTPAFTAILNHFGEAALTKNGTLDRAKLRHIIFTDTDQRCWLEDLLHPLIRDEIEKRIKEIKAPYCIAVIPLLLEVKPYHFIDRILIVDSPESLQLERAAARDKSERAYIEAIVKTQVDRQHRLAQAHDVIVNDGNIADLIPQVESLHQQYLTMAGCHSEPHSEGSPC
ncbi:MAG: dephospho-CoA kinase [Gammaproteobacteria bacterium]|nr:MAG: dephospho-CoA kinase [Gammaproteobacteria bacterium]